MTKVVYRVVYVHSFDSSSETIGTYEDREQAYKKAKEELLEFGLVWSDVSDKPEPTNVEKWVEKFNGYISEEDGQSVDVEELEVAKRHK